MKQTKRVTASLGIGLAVAVIGSTAATGTAEGGSHVPPVGTFRFELRAVPDNQEGQVDLPPTGPSLGDEFVTADDVVDRSGKTIGHTNGYCVLTSVVHFDEQCAQTLYLRNGSVELAIGAHGGGSTFTLAVVGGTHRWVGARGTAILRALDPNANRSKLTLRLIR
jgi:hypothetical protein